MDRDTIPVLAINNNGVDVAANMCAHERHSGKPADTSAFRISHSLRVACS
jgi:hypothetical protein